MLSVGVWQPPDGPAKLDLSVKCSKLEPTTIGRNRPPREDRADHQRPLREDRPFDDPLGF